MVKIQLKENNKKVYTFKKKSLELAIIYKVFLYNNSQVPFLLKLELYYRRGCLFIDGFVGSVRKKRAHVKEVREKSVLQLYNKLVEVVSLLAELLSIQTLTDTAVLHISSTGISPFFVEGISELQLSALKLVTNVSVRSLFQYYRIFIDFYIPVREVIFYV